MGCKYSVMVDLESSRVILSHFLKGYRLDASLCEGIT